MRFRALILCMLLFITAASAKDVITKTDGSKIDVKVEEITETVIKYRKASNPTGPVYTIPLSSVATILYENGEIESFNTSDSSTNVSKSQSQNLSDDELIGMADLESLTNFDNTGNLSDAQLLKMANATSYQDLYNNARKYRKIGWYGGGGILILSSIVWGLATQDVEGLGGGVSMGLITGGIWCLGFNLRANYFMKKARQIQSYSATIIENQILKIGDNSLTAGINLMGNRMTQSHSLGLSLGLNF